jgi:hypothetical protein
MKTLRGAIMSLDESKQIEGLFIAFEKDELADVKKALDILGYTPDGKGMKELLLDALFGDGEDDRESNTERFIRKTHSYIKEHPETVKLGISALKNLAGMFGQSRK